MKKNKQIVRFWNNHLYNIIDYKNFIYCTNFTSKRKAEASYKESLLILKKYLIESKIQYTTWQLSQNPVCITNIEEIL